MRHGVVRATAGAGKTTTLIQVAEELPRDLSICFLAFSNVAKEELKKRLPKGVRSMTVHALGRRTLINNLKRKVELKNDKYREYIREAMNELGDFYNLPHDQFQVSREYLSELVKFSRLNLTNTKSLKGLRALAARYNLTPPRDDSVEDELYSRVHTLVRRGVREALSVGIIDFIDMIYVPYVEALEPPRYDFVCIDEAQDYSALALEFTLRLVDEQSGGRLLFVGDPMQSIFGFAGADTDALDRIIRRTNATILPLNITYRCPTTHVELARVIAPEIQAGPGAPKGKVYWIRDTVLEKWVRKGDLILSRANAPLMSVCLQLVRKGMRATVRGRDIAKQISTIAKTVFHAGFNSYKRRLKAYEKSEIARLSYALRGSSNSGTVIALRVDLIRCLEYLVEHMLLTELSPSLDLLVSVTEATFREGVDAIELSTVHKAKGREKDRVFILRPRSMPVYYTRTAEAMRGEACLMFVALTRAKRDLVFVEATPDETSEDFAYEP